MEKDDVAKVAVKGDSQLMRLLNEAAERLLAATHHDRAVADLFQLISSELRLDVYFNYVVGEDGGLQLASSYGLDETARREGDRLQLGAAVCGEVAERRLADYVPDIQQNDEPRAAFIKAVGLQCYACTPMIAGDRLLGTLGFGRRWSKTFTPEELQFVRTVTHYVAMAFERLRTESALRESERRLNAVLDNASVAIFLMDDRQHCAYMNAAAERLTGFAFSETLGRPLHDVIHHTRPDGSHFPLHECAIDRAFPENAHEQGEEIFVHKDGHFYPVAFTASPIRDDASRTIGTIIEVRDITREKRTEQARELLMREVDHRARNALAVVQSMIQLTEAPDIVTFRDVVIGRVSALGRAQGSLAAQQWEGAYIAKVVAEELDAISKGGQYLLDGPDVMLNPGQAQPTGMIFHELATNAVKYGALGRHGGKVEVTWRLVAGDLEIVWRETGGPQTAKPTRAGFGSRLISTLARQLRAELTHDWMSEGLVVRLRVPREAPTSG